MRVLSASCVGQQVTCGSGIVTGVTILSEGVSSSSGYLIIDQDRKYYVSKTSPDLKSTIEAIASALGQIATALTTIDAKPVGGSGSAPAPGAAANITQITALQTQLTTLKDALK